MVELQQNTHSNLWNTFWWEIVLHSIGAHVSTDLRMALHSNDNSSNQIDFDTVAASHGTYRYWMKWTHNCRKQLHLYKSNQLEIENQSQLVFDDRVADVVKRAPSSSASITHWRNRQMLID